MKTVCDACRSPELDMLYTLERIPAFQNKLFPTQEAAVRTQTARVSLACCRRCNLVFNAAFQNDLMDYDGDYQNAQDHSPSFRDYLTRIASLVTEDVDLSRAKLVEIGCGKGYFLRLLEEQGADIIGFDPTFEGEHPRITKAYFNRDTAKGLAVDAIIMRHTLEHIESPLDFLLGLKEFLNPDVTIAIEIPRFEWIVEHTAFWDIFHEHCNYFTEAFFQHIFGGKAIIHRTFSDQYMVVKARIGDVQQPTGQHGSAFANVFSADIPRYHAELRRFRHNYVWGAGAKGIAFANILDAEAQHIDAVIDINHRKQQCFLPLTGHACVSPESIEWASIEEDTCLWIMNDNYKAEILAALPKQRHFTVRTLGEDT